MDNWMEITRIIIKAVFFAIVPGVVIYYRIKKKVKTGFAIGLVFTSLFFGMMAATSVKEDPTSKFIELVNLKKYDEARKAYKVLVQWGPEYLEKINENEIVDIELFNRLKKDVISEYQGIAEKYLQKYTVSENSECSKFQTEMNNLGSLKHARNLVLYSESIGGTHDTLSKELQEKIDNGTKIINLMEERCK